MRLKDDIIVDILIMTVSTGVHLLIFGSGLSDNVLSLLVLL